ncbi:MAG: rhomboid family intramembrane serine protease [Angelakisella sp.]
MMDKFQQKLGRLEYKYGRYAIHNLMIYICSTMLAIYFLQYLIGVPIVNWITLYRPAILHGQLWRLVTFLFVPPGNSPVWLLFSLYFYYFIGNALEQHWGAFRFNLYYLSGMLFAIAAGMITGAGTAEYLNLSLFLAFAQLFPDTEFLLFFFLPIKAKWLAWLNWGLFALQFLVGGLSIKVTILFAIGNFMLFFGKDMIDGIRYRSKYRSNQINFRKAMRDRDRRDR